MNWGTKIGILYGCFVLLIVGMVTLSMLQKVDLVAADYYEQELNFQQKIDKSKRAQALVNPLKWVVNPNSLQIVFPAEFKGQQIQGLISLFRPSDAALDQTLPIAVDSGLIQNIALKNFKPGAYKLQIDWQVGTTKYYNEGFIKIN